MDKENFRRERKFYAYFIPLVRIVLRSLKFMRDETNY